MKGLLADLKHALRLYRSTKASSAIAVAVLAVGMAFVGAFLSLYVDLILRPHPGFERSGRIATIGQTDGRQLGGLPYTLIERMAGELTSLEAVAGVMSTSDQGGPEGEPRWIELVTRGFFGGLRPRLALGRGFEPAEHAADAERVVVISHRDWQERLDGRRDVIGTTIEITLERGLVVVAGERLDPEARTDAYRIVGVMARQMPGVRTDGVSYWMPIEQAVPFLYGRPDRPIGRTLSTLGRLGPGVSAEAVASELDARYRDSDEDLGLVGMSNWRFDATTGVVRNISVQREAERQLELFLAGSVLLALVAACNVSLFLLARAPGRRRELGIRMAVGARFARLGRQLASEAALLVVVSAALGLLLSVWLSEFLRSLAFLREAEWSNVTLLDWRVVTLVGAFLLLLTLTVSLAPVLGLRRLGIAASSRQVAARATVAQRLAGTAQIAIGSMLGGAGIAFAWYLSVLVFGYAGYETRDLHVASFSADFSSIASMRSSAENAVLELARRREAIEGLPGISGVSFGSPIPGALVSASAANGFRGFDMPHPADPSRRVPVRVGTVDSRYIELLGLRLIHGRAPMDGETAVALVNQTFARETWGREDIVGESVPSGVAGRQMARVVGVLEDLSFEHPSADVPPIAFTADVTSNPFYMTSPVALVRSTLSTADLREALQGLVDEGGLEMTLASLTPLSHFRRDLIAPDRARAFLTIATAALVVFLAAFGFYGTQRYLVAAGRVEYAIRAALGAGPRALGRLVFTRGLTSGLPGLALGALLAFIAVAWLRDDFVTREVSPTVVALAVVAGLILLLVAASAGPARQARRTQPAPLLREE